MKRRTAALGSALLIAGLYLFFNPGTATAMSGSLGIAGTQSVYDKTNFVAVGPLNYSHVDVKLAPGDSLKMGMNANPGGVDVLLMNQGNFSIWAASKVGSYETYPQSALRVSNYSFAFASGEPSQIFYILLVSHSSSQTTDILVHIGVTRPTDYSAYLPPILLGFAGVALMGYAVSRGRPRKAEALQAQPAAPLLQSQSVAAGNDSSFCHHCGTALELGSPFCPSCSKSQS